MNQHLDKFKKLSTTTHLSLYIAALLLVTIGITINNAFTKRKAHAVSGNLSANIDSFSQKKSTLGESSYIAQLPVTPTIYCLGSCPTTSPTPTCGSPAYGCNYPTPTPTQPPLPTQSPNQPILVDCNPENKLKGPQEIEMLWAYSLDSSRASGNELALKAFYTNKYSLLLGSGSVSPMQKHPADHVSNPKIGNTGVKDIDGFPLFPAIFLTDTTFSPRYNLGDAQFGGQPNKPDDVYGTWKASGAPDPTANGNNLGLGADPWPPSNGPATGPHDSNFTSEIIWKLSNVKAIDPSTKSYLTLQQGHRYRAQTALHDGANPTPDIGVACINFLMPGALLATPTPTPTTTEGPSNQPSPSQSLSTFPSESITPTTEVTPIASASPIQTPAPQERKDIFQIIRDMILKIIQAILQFLLQLLNLFSFK